jgi:hypothetical protein
MTTELLQQALDALEIARDLHCLPGPVNTLVYQSIRAIQVELAQPVVSLDTLDHIEYQGRPSLPSELAPPPVALTPMGDEKIWVLATECTIGSDLHIDKFARAIEAAHGIGDKT